MSRYFCSHLSGFSPWTCAFHLVLEELYHIGKEELEVFMDSLSFPSPPVTYVAISLALITLLQVALPIVSLALDDLPLLDQSFVDELVCVFWSC